MTALERLAALRAMMGERSPIDSHRSFLFGIRQLVSTLLRLPLSLLCGQLCQPIHMNGWIYSPPRQPGHHKQGEDTRQKRIAEFYVESLACTYICNLTTNLDTLHYCLVLLRSAGNIFNLQASKCRYAH
jgi:hypothetical protein